MLGDPLGNDKAHRARFRAAHQHGGGHGYLLGAVIPSLDESEKLHESTVLAPMRHRCRDHGQRGVIPDLEGLVRLDHLVIRGFVRRLQSNG